MLVSISKTKDVPGWFSLLLLPQLKDIVVHAMKVQGYHSSRPLRLVSESAKNGPFGFHGESRPDWRWMLTAENCIQAGSFMQQIHLCMVFSSKVLLMPNLAGPL
jgi:hypothetical protein